MTPLFKGEKKERRFCNGFYAHCLSLSFLSCSVVQVGSCLFLVHCQSGLKEYIGANPAVKSIFATTVVHSKACDDSIRISEYEDAEINDEFYDAISADSLSSEESDDEDEPTNEVVCFYLNLFCLVGISK